MGDYVVRLVLRVQADSEADAPRQFVKYLVEGGLISWMYRVEHPETHDVLGYFNGDGVPVDMDQLVADLDAATGDTDDDDEDDEPVQTPVESISLPDVEALATGLEVTVTTSATPSDDELVALAESLNETEQL